ncbi:hypothetical protein BCR39DRAFT_545254 [Naematelia encephala]|uniref:Uncharacterized protein n=1 Tax=Naematelia encephala TaxID=71784 RepID=A0A1Y2AT14_9TREE|nr:hypothetical protein BCR39DRAFT_545254 [Naematelia encephala]
MPRWEARFTGLSSLYFALFFNLGLVGLKLKFAQWTICSIDAIIDHPFITNRLSAKVHHLKARAMEMLATLFPKDPSDEPTTDPFGRPDYAYESKRHDATRDVYARLSPNKVSFASECCDFDVRSAMDAAHKLEDYGDLQMSVEREFEEDGVLGRAETIMRERTEPVWLLGEEL